MLPPGEHIVETKVCPLSGEEFIVTDKDLEFYDKISPVFGGKKYSIPSPTLSPVERQRRRLSFRNEQSLYMRKCDLSGRQIISMYDAHSKYTIYDKDIWYSDDWDPYIYGKSFDFETSFFEQFGELFVQVPRMARVQQSGMENSEFCNCASRCKDCYLCFSTNQAEKCCYGTFNNHSYLCIDNYNIINCEMCYECMDCYRCYNCIRVIESTDCSESIFCKNCIGCKDCIFCINLQQKQYCIMNKQYTKKEYEEKKKQLQMQMFQDFEQLENRFQQILKKSPVRYMYGIQNESSSGNTLDHCQNAQSCFESRKLENCKYVTNVIQAKDCMDYNYWGTNCDHIYETMACGFNCSNILFGDHVWENNSNIILSESCMHSHNLLGCDGLRNAKNCIFNTPYSRHEYEQLAGKIIDHMKQTNEWGEFFPAQMSDFAYNETVANDYYPLTKEQCTKRGLQWKNEDETQSYHGKYHTPKTIDSYDESIVGIKQAKENITACTREIHICQQSGKPFKIIPQELTFYIQNKIPLPTVSPTVRHKKRIFLRNPRSVHIGNCDRCRKEIQTSYNKEKVGEILCEECYREVVY